MRKRSPNEASKRRVPATAARTSPSAVALEACSPDDFVLRHPHRFEQDVRFRLMAEPTLNFTSLTVRRIANGVCLEGVLETDDDVPDISSLVRRITGVEEVLNYLVVRRAHAVPPKG
jgi:hypothetical protein